MPRFLPALVIVVAISAPAQSAPDFSRARNLIRETMVAGATPSITVAVARKGRIIWEEGFGWANRERRIAATEHTMYYTASVTKTFTGTALMILQERKRLDLDRPVNDYLGPAKLISAAFDPAGATVRRVETHTAGLTTFNPTTPMSIDEKIRRFGVILWPPGERFDYSNLGPIVLQEVISRVSGRPYADFVRQEIFWPLGMTRASNGVAPELAEYAAQRYSFGGALRPVSDGAIYCSAHDLALFGMFHLKAHRADQKAVLIDASIDAMQNETVPTPFGRYGIGWNVEENRYGFRSVLAQGGTDADQAWMRLLPSEEIAVVVLSNIGSTPGEQIIDEILSAMLPTYAEKRAAAAAVTARAVTAKTAPALPSGTLTGTWDGVIRSDDGDVPLSLTIFPSGDVHAKLGTQLPTLLNQPRFRETQLSGIMTADLHVGATAVKLYLYLREGTLQGAAVTDPSPQLPYWVDLKKAPESASPAH
jgi:CubicO group peptidase (beta-lactamase class C family)